jgi:hypothetical protein
MAVRICKTGMIRSYIVFDMTITVTYDHRLKRIGHPVRSAIHKLEIGGLVVGWVTTSEYPLLYVFLPIFFVSLYKFCLALES